MSEVVIKTDSQQPQQAYRIIKTLCHSRQISMAELVRRRNALHPDEPTTPQNLSNKLSRDSLKLTEFIELLNILGYDRLICREQSTHLVDMRGNPLIKNDSDNDNHLKLSPIQKSFTELLSDGFCEVRAVNFQSAIVAGKLCEDAAAWIQSNLSDDTDETQEVMLYLAASRQFKVKVKPVSNDTTKEYSMI